MLGYPLSTTDCKARKSGYYHGDEPCDSIHTLRTRERSSAYGASLFSKQPGFIICVRRQGEAVIFEMINAGGAGKAEAAAAPAAEAATGAACLLLVLRQHPVRRLWLLEVGRRGV